MGTLRFECARTVLVIGVGLAVSTGCGDCASERAAAASEARALAEEAEAKTRAEAAAAREAQRLAALWNYHDVEAGTGQQLTATITSTENIDTGGNGLHRAQLVFRDHPSWGRSSYLVLAQVTSTAIADARSPSPSMTAHRRRWPRGVREPLRVY
jgi:hypothetical protein